MCGLTGLWDVRHSLGSERLGDALRRMTPTLACRGPDDEGRFQDKEAGMGLGHRRLSILDLSPEGHQPMVSSSGRYVLAYNGEIYNFRDLRHALEGKGYSFRGHSDTEILLAAIEQWGLKEALRRSNGMFALALWDRHTRTLSLGRDRVGIKPLYYGWFNGLFVFGSELKAIRAVPGFNASIDRDALTLLLRHNNVPAPYSIHEGIYKLVPGTILRVDADTAVRMHSLADQASKTETFWSAREIAELGQKNRFEGTRGDAVSKLETLLRDSVKIRMAADVPLGAFLSGGIDSSTVVALMQSQSERRVKTFSIGFKESMYDEAQHAKAVARHLGTDHTELYISPDEALNVIPSLPEIYDEPFADHSQIPTFLVSQLARKSVTVSLSGDGGDELFCGYNRYFWGKRIWERFGRSPPAVRRQIARLLNLSPRVWGGIIAAGMPMVPARYRVKDARGKVDLLTTILEMPSPDALYYRLVSAWQAPEDIVLDGREPLTALTDPLRQARLDDYVERMMFSDFINYLPDDLLVKVDRASMAVSLEARVPLLDHRVVEFAASLPLAWNMGHPQGKWPLRQVLNKYVPHKLIERPKQGFGVPLQQWLRGPLREWAEELLSQHRLRKQGFFKPEPIRNMWAELVAGRETGGSQLWNVLMFEAWLDKQQDSGQAACETPTDSVTQSLATG